MNNRIASFLAVSACFLGLSAAQAGELDYPAPQETASHATREEVRQELAQAREQGPVFAGELDPAPFAAVSGTLSRAQVEQARDQARQQGWVSRGNLDYPPARG
ncbi:DUF4148 domain-containing protein [Orrella sp. JC864]|uniref:DUF4148 domain-containing protein n=1 Tax=Orrella sp. JC864 TaxID=3120298 RepID=UPI0030098D62